MYNIIKYEETLKKKNVLKKRQNDLLLSLTVGI